ncbi:MAG: oligosaccharide flippase family protein [Alistipes sp.]|nr:oligosaccharide flippase family protein [Alistipes sp.]
MAVSQLKAGAILNYVVLGLSNLVGLLYTPYMLRMMGQSEYGLYSLVASVIAYLTIMDFGFGNAIIRYTAKYRAEGKFEEQYAMFGMFLILYSAIGVIAFCGGLGLYFNVDALFGDTMSTVELERARVLMLIMLFNLGITFPLSIFGSIITAYEDFIFQKTVQIVRIVLNTLVMIFLLQKGYKAVAMVVVQTVFNFLTLILNLFYCKYKIRIRFIFGKFKWGFLKEVSIYSFWIFLGIIIDRIYWSTGQFVLGTTEGAVAVAVFAVAIQFQNMYMSFSTAISGVVFPRITALVANHRTDREISDIFIRVGRIQYMVVAFILSGFVIFGRQFIIQWAGADYEEAYTIALLFFAALTIPLIQNVGISVLQARNQMKFRSLSYVVIAVGSLVGQVLLARKFGSIGCAVAIAGALFVGQGLVMNIYYYKVQKLDILKFWQEIARMSVAPIFLTLGCRYLVTQLNLSDFGRLGGAIMLYTIVYIPMFWCFGMNESERSMIGQPIQRVFKLIFK